MLFTPCCTRDKLSKVVKNEQLREADYNLSPSQFLDISEKFVHREISDILADLVAARQAREWADKDLDEVLVKLNLGD